MHFLIGGAYRTLRTLHVYATAQQPPLLIFSAENTHTICVTRNSGGKTRIYYATCATVYVDGLAIFIPTHFLTALSKLSRHYQCHLLSLAVMLNVKLV